MALNYQCLCNIHDITLCKESGLYFESVDTSKRIVFKYFFHAITLSEKAYPKLEMHFILCGRDPSAHLGRSQ